MTSLPPWARSALAALVALLVGVGVTIAVTTGTDESGKPTRTVSVRVGGPVTPPPTTRVDTNGSEPGVQPGTVTAPAADRKAVASSELGDHEDARNETPAGVSRADLEAGREAQDKLAANDQLPAVTPDAAPSQRGCSTALVRNYSTRRGVKPRLFVLHYTVSPNRSGIGDVNAVVGLFNTPSFSASSNYVIDREGNCKYIVRESDKAWTQAAANPFAISVEIINSGRESSLISGAGKAKLARVIADSTKRWGIPLQRGAVNGCTPSRPGVVTHQNLGPCGGGHVDVSPFDREVSGIIAAAKRLRAGAKPVTAVDRATCSKLNAYRRDVRAHVKVSADRTRINVARRKALEGRRIVCTAHGPVRR